MKLAAYAFAGLVSVGLGLAACTTVTENAAPAPSPSHSTSSAPGSAATPRAAPSAQQPSAQQPSAQQPSAQPQSPSTVPNVTDPWAVVSAYYGDIESGNYQQAWALLDSGATTGQTYQQFVNGFACTGSQSLSEVSESGDQVTFNLTAADTCTGQVQHYTGTDTVMDGKIVAADVHQDG